MTESRASSWAVIGDGPRTRAEHAFEAIHEGILTGELAAGERLRIEELAAALKMSHLPIREAIRQLESHGLVEHIPHRGARVAELSISELTELYDARLLIEPEIIRRAANQFSDADAQAARAAFVRHTEVRADARRVERWQTHTDFHFALYEPCRSPWLLRLLTPLWKSSQRYRMTIPAVNAVQRRREAAVEHKEMLEACVARDGKRAAEVVCNHLVGSANLITDHLGAPRAFVARGAA